MHKLPVSSPLAQPIPSHASRPSPLTPRHCDAENDSHPQYERMPDDIHYQRQRRLSQTEPMALVLRAGTDGGCCVLKHSPADEATSLALALASSSAAAPSTVHAFGELEREHEAQAGGGRAGSMVRSRISMLLWANNLNNAAEHSSSTSYSCAHGPASADKIADTIRRHPSICLVKRNSVTLLARLFSAPCGYGHDGATPCGYGHDGADRAGPYSKTNGSGIGADGADSESAAAPPSAALHTTTAAKGPAMGTADAHRSPDEDEDEDEDEDVEEEDDDDDELSDLPQLLYAAASTSAVVVNVPPSVLSASVHTHTQAPWHASISSSVSRLPLQSPSLPPLPPPPVGERRRSGSTESTCSACDYDDLPPLTFSPPSSSSSSLRPGRAVPDSDDQR